MTVAQLLERVNLHPASLPFEVEASSPFEVMVPPHFLSLIRKGDPRDPLLLQVIARLDERSFSKAASVDPLQEKATFRGHGIIQKYSGRLLVLLSGACAIHCRYCFRRHYDYGPLIFTNDDLDSLIQTLADDHSIREVILSGGDPLSVTDDKLEHILSRLDTVKTLSAIRFHTRTLTAVPSRVTFELLTMLSALSKKVIIVIHTNHPREIDSVVCDALQQVKNIGATILNQSVLLAGVNDNSETLCEHSWRLLSAGVLPYYVHMLDKVIGSEHFEVSAARALELQTSLREALPGYLVPTFVREIPEQRSKVPLISSVASKRQSPT